MKKITRTFGGAELTIDLTPDEIKEIIAEYATITMKTDLSTAEPVPEPKVIPLDVVTAENKPERIWKPVGTRRCGVLAQHEAEVIEMYQQGLSLRQVGEHYGVASSSVRDFLTRRGIPMRDFATAHRLISQKRVSA